MNPQNFDLNLLKIVLAVAQYKTVSKAAEFLNVTQPAVSNALARLRDITGDPIFIRGGEGQVPTEYGKSLIQLSRNVMAQVRTCMENPDHFDPNKTSRRFLIAIDDFLEITLIPHLLKVIAPYHANIELRFFPIKSMDLSTVMEADEIDLCINIWFDTQEKVKRIQFHELMTDQVCVALAKQHAMARKTKLSKEDFLKMDYVIVRPNYRRYQMPEFQLRNLGIHRNTPVQTSQATSLPAIAAGGKFAITVPRILFSDFIRLYDLKTYDMPFIFKPVSIVAGVHVRDRKNPEVNWLLDKFREATTSLSVNSVGSN